MPFALGKKLSHCLCNFFTLQFKDLAVGSLRLFLDGAIGKLISYCQWYPNKTYVFADSPAEASSLCSALY